MRILIADDNEVIRRGVISLLASRKDMEVCGEAKDGMEAIEMARRLSPDVILLDVSMPVVNGLEAVQRLRQEKVNAKILIISQHDPVRLLPSVIAAGAEGCVDKGRLGTDLVTAIERLFVVRSAAE